MIFELITLLLSFIAYITYIIIVYKNFKPDSISNSYYLIKNKTLFTIWIMLVAILAFPSWVSVSPELFLFLSFLSILSLISVGIHPKYLEEHNKIHIISATIACILSITWSILVGMWIIPAALFIIAILLYIYDIENKLFWTEFLAFLNIYSSVLWII